jgi:hypothetical protein
MKKKCVFVRVTSLNGVTFRTIPANAAKIVASYGRASPVRVSRSSQARRAPSMESMLQTWTGNLVKSNSSVNNIAIKARDLSSFCDLKKDALMKSVS